MKDKRELVLFSFGDGIGVFVVNFFISNIVFVELRVNFKFFIYIFFDFLRLWVVFEGKFCFLIIIYYSCLNFMLRIIRFRLGFKNFIYKIYE